MELVSDPVDASSDPDDAKLSVRDGSVAVERVKLPPELWARIFGYVLVENNDGKRDLTRAVIRTCRLLHQIGWRFC
jgi:hypothetical protein